MPFTPLAGKYGSVAIGGDTFCFDSWSATMSDAVSEVASFCSEGFSLPISGLQKMDPITLSGPYDSGNMPFTLGSTVTLTLGFTDLVALTVTAIVKEIKVDVKVDDAIRVEITCASQGTFTPQIL